MSKSGKILGLVAVMIWVLSTNLPAREIAAIWGHQTSASRGELFWFCDGINELELAYDNGISEIPHYLSTIDYDNRSAVRCDSLEPPIFIMALRAYIYGTDYFPELPGNQYTPFDLAIYSDKNGHPDSLLSGPFTAQADGNWIGDGEWVEVRSNCLLADRNLFWNTFIWKKGFPTAPMLGANLSTQVYKSFDGYYDNGWSWQTWPDGNFMLRAILLRNDISGIQSLDSAAMPDSFRVYMSVQPELYPAENFYYGTSIGKLHLPVHLYSPKNYFCVTGFWNGVESGASKVFMIAGNSGKHAKVDFEPVSYEINLPLEGDTSLILALHNKNGTELHYRFSDITIGTLKANGPITVIINPSSDSIADDQTDSIRFELNASGAAEDIYSIAMKVEFWDSAQGYVEEVYEIQVKVGSPTSVDEDNAPIPEKYGLRQNYPNPFNGTTSIPYKLNSGAEPSCLEIYDLLGRKIISVPLTAQKDGYYLWDGKDQNGSAISSGIYFYKLRGEKDGHIFKMIYMK